MMMSVLSIVASLYIFIGGLGFLLNVTAMIFLVYGPQRSFVPLTIYGISDTLSGSLTGIGLFCDGCLYFSNVHYGNACSRYFLMYTLLFFPIVTSSFSALGVAMERYNAVVINFQQHAQLQRLVSLIWMLISWFIALAFVIVLWGHTRSHSDPINKDDNFFCTINTTVSRTPRALVDKMWNYNSQYDWTSDYQENVIIGLVYGIINNNITHKELLGIHGLDATNMKKFFNYSQDKILKLHSTYNISKRDVYKMIATSLQDLNETLRNVDDNSTQHRPSKHTIDSLNNSSANINNYDSPLQEINNSKNGSLTSIKLNNSNNLNNKSKIDILSIESIESNMTNRINTPIILRNESMIIKDVNLNISSINSSFSTNNTDKINKTNKILIKNNPISLETNKQIIDTKQVLKQLENTTMKSPNVINAKTVNLNNTNNKTHNISIELNNQLSNNDVIHNNDNNTSILQHLNNKLNATNTNITKDQQLQLLSPDKTITKLKKPYINENENKKEDKTIKYLYDNNDGDFERGNPLNMSEITTNPTEPQVEEPAWKPPDQLTRMTVCHAHDGFLSVFMTILVVFVHILPLVVSTGLYTQTVYTLHKHHPPNTRSSAYTTWSRTKKTTLRVLFIQAAYIICWTPFIVERLLYAWSIIPCLQPIIPPMLFLLGHTHNLLKGLLYVFDDAQVRATVSAMTLCSTGCNRTSATTLAGDLPIPRPAHNNPPPLLLVTSPSVVSLQDAVDNHSYVLVQREHSSSRRKDSNNIDGSIHPIRDELRQTPNVHLVKNENLKKSGRNIIRESIDLTEVDLPHTPHMSGSIQHKRGSVHPSVTSTTR